MIMALCRGIAEWIWWFGSAFKLVFWSGAMPGLLLVLVVLVIFAAWFGAGYLAATIAELAGKKRSEAFMTGLFMPWAYARNLAATSTVAPTEEEIAEAEAKAQAAEFEAEEDEYADEEIDGFCKAWFAQIPVDSDGERQGPFRLVLLDGTELDLDVIRDLRDDLMVVVNSATGKTLRIRYDNIADFEDLNEYEEE